jgi:hypothetical protein
MFFQDQGLASMQIVGEWWKCDDGVLRPTVRASVLAADGRAFSERFLVDCCADRTVLSATLLARLGIAIEPPQAGLMLQGIGGQSPFVELATAVEFVREDGDLSGYAEHSLPSQNHLPLT